MTFESLDDFSPEAVARKVGPLKELLDLRTKLADLRGSLQGNDKLEEILQNTLNDAGRDEEAGVGDGLREAAMAEAQAQGQPQAADDVQSPELEPARQDRRRRPHGPRRRRQGARQGSRQEFRQRGARGHGRRSAPTPRR